MWFDYLDLLNYLHLDTHNPRYVCPVDLHAEHDRLLERKRIAEQKKREEEKRKEALKWETTYREDKQAYFGICFGNEHLTITVIQSVSDMMEEGKAMHHCVFDMEYYKRKDSLILTARGLDGERIETIELNLKTFEVVQSRGIQNKSTRYHKEILQLMRSNVDKFKAAKAIA
jgi:hypothetical protein